MDKNLNFKKKTNFKNFFLKSTFKWENTRNIREI